MPARSKLRLVAGALLALALSAASGAAAASAGWAALMHYLGSVQPFETNAQFVSSAITVKPGGAPNMAQYSASPIYDDEASCDFANETFTTAGKHAWYFQSGSQGGQGGTVYVTYDYYNASPAPAACPGDGYMHLYANYYGGVWHMATLAAQDTSHEGFSCIYCTFVFKARLNSAALPLQPWPGIWVFSRHFQNNANNFALRQYIEYDLMESCNASLPCTGNFNSSVNYWPGTNPASGQQITSRSFVTQAFSRNVFDDNPHIWQLSITPMWAIWYLDGAEIQRFATKGADMRQMSNPMLDVASYFGPTGSANQSQQYDLMDVAYVRVYQCIQPGMGCTT